MIKYAGIALCLDIPELLAVVDSKIPLRRHLIETSRSYPSGSPWAWLETFDIPFPEIGTLYWPNTASRWAVGRFLAHRSMVDQIVKTVYQLDKSEDPDKPKPDDKIDIANDFGQPISATLQLGFDGEALPNDPITINAPIANPNLIKAKMFMLPPLPLAFTEGPDDLFLLTFVDERYYWRWLELPEFMKQLTQCGSARKTIPWDTVIEDLKAVLETFRGTGFQVPQQLEEDYLEADPWTILRDPQESKPRTFPEIMDMVAWNLGRTVTVNYSSRVFMYSFDESDAFHQDELLAFGGLKSRAAGWDISEVFPSTISSIIPEKISFSFPEYHAIYGLRTVCTKDEGKEEITKTLTEALDEEEEDDPKRNKGLAGTVMQVNSSAWRLKGDEDLDDFGGDGGFVLDDRNFTKLNDLAERLTKDIFDRLSRSFDISMNSIQNFIQNGLIGITEFHYSGGRQECYTRIRSFPWNAYPEVFNHQDPDIPDPMYKMNFAISDEAWLDEDEPVLMTLLDDEEVGPLSETLSEATTDCLRPAPKLPTGLCPADHKKFFVGSPIVEVCCRNGFTPRLIPGQPSFIEGSYECCRPSTPESDESTGRKSDESAGRKILVHTKMGLPELGFPQDTIFHIIWYQEEQCDCKWVAVGAECPEDIFTAGEPPIEVPPSEPGGPTTQECPPDRPVFFPGGPLLVPVCCPLGFTAVRPIGPAFTRGPVFRICVKLPSNPCPPGELFDPLTGECKPFSIVAT